MSYSIVGRNRKSPYDVLSRFENANMIVYGRTHVLLMFYLTLLSGHHYQCAIDVLSHFAVWPPLSMCY